MLEKQFPEAESSEAMRAMRESNAVVRIDVDAGHRVFIEAVLADDRYGLVDYYEIRTRGSHVSDSTYERDGMWVRRELARNEFSLIR